MQFQLNSDAYRLTDRDEGIQHCSNAQSTDLLQHPPILTFAISEMFETGRKLDIFSESKFVFFKTGEMIEVFNACGNTPISRKMLTSSVRN